MHEYNELFIGLDTSKAKISVAVAEKERNGEVRFFGDISAEPTSVASMVASYQVPNGFFTRETSDLIVARIKAIMVDVDGGLIVYSVAAV